MVALKNAILIIILITVGFWGQAFCDDKIPGEFRSLYKHLGKTLKKLNGEIDEEWDGTLSHSFIPMASVLPANSNSGERLLNPYNIGFTRKYLEQLKSLGCKGVQLDIQFPLFDPEFFAFIKGKGIVSGDYPDDIEYLKYYKEIVKEIRNLGLKLSIESQVVFTQKTWSPLPVKSYYEWFDLSGEKGLKAYNDRKLEMLKLIAVELKPDYFTICNEPDTEMWLTGIKLLKEKSNYIDMITRMINGLKPHLGKEMKLGAGFGVWDDNWKYWLNVFTEMDLDFLNFHIYAIDNFAWNSNDNIIPRLIEAADRARAAGMGSCIGETWLYKRGRTDTRDPIVIFGRDYFDFWVPLDREYIRLILKIAHMKKFDFVSPFWSTFFFSYLSYKEAVNLNTAERKRMNNRRAAKNVNAGIFSTMGLSYREMLKNGP